MKTWEDVINRAKAELNKWFVSQCRDGLSDFYMWYRPSFGTDRGDLTISKERPTTEHLLVRPQRINKGATVERNFRDFYDLLRKLPILDVTNITNVTVQTKSYK